MFQFENLTPNNILEIVEYLDAQDLVNLSHSNSYLFNLFKENQIWKRNLKVIDLTQHRIWDLLFESKVLDLNELERILAPREDFKFIVIEQLRIENQQSTCSGNSEPKEMIEIQNLIHQFRNTQDFQLIYKIISRAFDLLWFYPIYSIYFIAFITFILNIPKISIEIIELGLTFDDMFEPLLELKKEVQDLLNGLEGEGQVPLLENNELSAKMKSVVRTIFLRYVKPGTRKMDINGLQHFITTTNKGVTPPREFVEHVFYNFAEGNGRNIAISIDGFEAFYLNLALSDPTETRQDLSQHGFEPSFLESTNEMDATRARIDKLSLH